MEFLDKLAADTPRIIAIELQRLLTTKSGPDPVKVLDVGSGSGEIWKRIESALLERSGEAGSLRVFLLDASPVEELSWSCGGFEVVRISGFLPGCLEKHKADEFDLIVALDVIEHLTKSDGYRLLYHLNRLTDCSVVQTPNGFLWQAPFLTNPFQAHISGWKPRELKALGWRRQFGLGGLKQLVGIGGRPHYAMSSSALRKRLKVLDKIIIHTTRILLSSFPFLHGEFIAIRRKREFDLEAEGLRAQVAK